MKLKQPTPAQIKKVRMETGLTQEEAANMVHLGDKRRWYEYENGSRNIDMARWELFIIKAGLHDDYKTVTPGDGTRTPDRQP